MYFLIFTPTKRNLHKRTPREFRLNHACSTVPRHLKTTSIQCAPSYSRMILLCVVIRSHMVYLIL